ncbi:hypothetical protein D083_4485 [Dickeya solani RNS 08.23.3.1.A]|nr:hypothetical protein D083_4485 [Dickeya solani RNS 08.23.3.1.A]
MPTKYHFRKYRLLTETPQKPAFSLSLRVFCCLLSAGVMRLQLEDSTT